MRMIAHSYDSYDHAVRAVNALEAAGVPHDDISLVSGDKGRALASGIVATPGTMAMGTGTETDTLPNTDTATGTGTGASIGTLLGGGAGLLAGIGALAIPGVGPVVAAGWLIATLTGAGVGAAAGGILGSLTGAGVDEADARTYAEHVDRGGTLVTVRAADEMAPEVEHILEYGEARNAPAIAVPNTAAAYTAAGTTNLAADNAAGTTLASGPRPTDDKLAVVKEDLVVGKREVDQGGVRVTSRVIETPVEQQVRLQEERISVERRPINRPLTGIAADAFRERSLTATSKSEEAVVGKEARVVEEIQLRKEAAERVETVRDTVRETKVDVEQMPKTATTIDTTTTGTSKGPAGS